MLICHQWVSAYRSDVCRRGTHVQSGKRGVPGWHQPLSEGFQVDTVYKTSPTLTVKQRIAEGLSRAGTSNTLKTISYNAILGVIAVFAVGVIRQFCVFAIVVLVAHWFLAHTFFMAVLSIDVQRLELDELLRHNTSLAPKVQTSPTTTRVAPSKRTWKSMALKGQTVLRGRATKNLSLLLVSL